MPFGGKDASVMLGAVKIAFAPFAAPAKGVLVVFTDEQLRLGAASRAALGRAGDLLARAGKAERFAGKMGSSLDFVAPADLKAARLIFIGTGKDEPKSSDFIKLGGIAMGKVPPSASEATILADLPGGAMSPEQASEIALGATLRAYSFDRYKTKRKEGEEEPVKTKVTIGVADAAAARRAWQRRNATAEGVTLARDLVNEPPNVLYPEEFARRASALKKTGVAVEVLDVKAMRRLGMNALLGVGRGSARQSRLVVMRWNGGKRGQPPLAFIGKGVTFDTGGISIKPAAGMEDMKGDMAGAACVVGLMHALAARKAKVNAIGAIGLVENMPSGEAQRPGAILVALGNEHAGMFSNDETLAERLTKAGQETAEKVWRMPLAPEYDKLIDSKFADVKNTGGRNAGSITAAQFLQRFVDKTPWAHLDIAGTSMGSPQSEVNRSWGSGWGVRLLDRLVAENYEN